MPQEHEFGCGACFLQADAATAWNRKQFTHIAELVDESHFHVTIMACKSCDQRCVKVFMEWVDWANSDDAQCWILVPLMHAESVELLAQGPALNIDAVHAMSANRKYLFVDYPSGGVKVISWKNGPCHIIRT